MSPVFFDPGERLFYHFLVAFDQLKKARSVKNQKPSNIVLGVFLSCFGQDAFQHRIFNVVCCVT